MRTKEKEIGCEVEGGRDKSINLKNKKSELE